MYKKNAFTLLEVLLTVTVVIIISSIIIIAINPAKSFLDSRNMQRSTNVGQIANGLYQYYVKNGFFPNGISSEWQIIGTGNNICQLNCGSDPNIQTDFFNIANDTTTFSGSHNLTYFNQTSNYLEMTTAGMQSGFASYTSPIITAPNTTSWEYLSVIPRSPYGKELPNNKAIENGYNQGSVDMSSNVLLLHLNETNGTIINDSSGNGLHGIIYDSSKYQINQSGILNQAIRFTNNSTNENGQIRVPHNNLLNFNTQGTVCAWVNISDTTQRYAGFVKKGHLSNFSDQEYTLQMYTGSSQPIFDVTDTTGADNFVTSSQALSPGVWTHLCGTVNTSGGIKIYVNGNLRGNIAWPSGRIMKNGTGSLQIGAQNISNNEYGMKGMIDEVAIFNRELTANEIQFLHERARLDIKFQVRTCNDISCNDSDFIGPDGTSSTYFSDETLSVTPYSINNLTSSKYFQYKIDFNSSLTSLTPQLASVTLYGTSSEITTGEQCIDLKAPLVEDYIVNIPFDPQFGTEENTYYAVKSTSPQRIVVRACAAEGGIQIEANK